jgi:hypothetical protein
MNGIGNYYFRYRGYFNVGSRIHGRDTFFCVAKRKYPKKKRPSDAYALRFSFSTALWVIPRFKQRCSARQKGNFR